MSDDQRPVRARLRGHGHDLQSLAELFPAGGDPVVEHDEAHGWAVLSRKLDASWGDTDALVAESNRLVLGLNAAGRLFRTDFEPIHHVPTFDGPGNSVNIVCADSIRIRVTVGTPSIGDQPPAPPPPRGAALLAAASRDGDLTDIIGWLGAPDLDTGRMWKVYEALRANAVGAERQGADRRLQAKGWLAESELASLRDAINNPHVSGEDARHGRYQRPHADPISLQEARRLLLGLVTCWYEATF